MAELTRPLAARGVTVIPPGWEAHHQPVTEAAMTAVIELWSGADPEWTWDDEAQAEVRDRGQKLWAGVARIQQRNDSDLEVAGDQQVTTHRYLVTLPREAGTGAWVRVAESTDPLLDWLKVVDTQKGSIRWERDLICTDNLG